MLKRLLFLLLTSVVSQLSYGQSTDDIKIPKIVPPSPDAAALGKYGQVPVDKSTGIPSISIPLYEIKTPRFSLPISLSYHASGIKVDELASWVGAGWSLNAGGMITRSIVGMADDYAYAGYFAVTVKKASQLQLPTDMNYIADVLNHRLDTDPDNFFYNFNNHSGSFVFGDDKKPVLTPYKPINIKYNLNTSTFASASNNFNITDENGDLYYFNTQENVTSNISMYMSGVSTWYLTMMVSADHSDTLKLVYATDAAQLIDNSYGFTQSLFQLDSDPGDGASLQDVEPSYSQRLFYPVRIQSILFNSGKVDFVAKGGRLDNGNNSLDSVIVSNQDPASKKYKRIKSFKLVTDYFYAGSDIVNDYDQIPVPDADVHRLKLTGVQEIGADHAVIKSHQFEYNTTTLPYVHSFAQDRWGYFNGNKGNKSLLESQTVFLGDNTGFPISLKIGATYNGAGNITSDYGADRSASPADMQAGVLNKITYPTGGYTTFTYDCNKSPGTVTNTYPVSASAQGWDINKNNVVVNYTPTAHMLETGGSIFHVTVQGVKDLLPFPYVKVMDSNGGEVWSSIGLVSSSNLYYDGTITIQLNEDVHYQLIAFAQGGGTPNTSNPITFSLISTSNQVTTIAALNMGGLRVSSIKNFNADGSIAGTETYAYGNNDESGIGVQFAFPPVFKYLKQYVTGFPDNLLTTKTIYSNNSIYPLSTFSGSPIAYPTVTLYHGDGSLNTGKSVYQYDIYPDSIAAIMGSTIDIVKPISMMWKNGEPISESHYRNNGNNQYTLVQQINNDFDFFWKKKGVGSSVGYGSLEPVGFTFDNPTVTACNSNFSQFCFNDLLIFAGNEYWNYSHFNWYDYPISSGIRVLKSSTNSQVATDGASSTVTTTNYIYDNLAHLFPTRIITTNSKGETITKKINYPQDMVNASKDPTGIYSTMVAANIISPTIEQYKSKNGTQLLYEKTNYDVFNTNMFKPKSVELQTLSNPSEVRLQYLDYDSKGNLGTVVKDTGPKIGYQWGCNKKYPVAEVVNAASNEFYYEGFEEKNATTQVAPAHSGQYYYGITNYTVNWPLPNARAYVISYWYLSAGVWTYMAEQTFTGTISLSNGTGYDDIRVYPKDAQMKTYTHTPLLGITSETDASNRTTAYYRYDNDGRLKDIRDQDNNIVKTFQYSYQQH